LLYTTATIQKQSCDAYFDWVNQLKYFQVNPHQDK